MFGVLITRVTQVPLSDQHQAIKALGFDRQHESLRVRAQVRALWRQANRFHSHIPQDVPELRREQWISIMDHVRLASKEPGYLVREVPRDLFHPRTIGDRTNSGDRHSTCRQIDHERHHVANKTDLPPHLDGEEVGRSETGPVRPGELRPRPRVSRAHRRSAVSPAFIVRGHLHDELPNFGVNPGPSWRPRSTAVVRSCDHLSVPTEDRIGCDDRPQLSQDLPPKSFALCCEAAPPVSVEPEAPLTIQFLEYSYLPCRNSILCR